MARYIYTISSKKGKEETGVVQADNRIDAAEQIKKSGWYILSLQKEKTSKVSIPFITKKDKMPFMDKIAFTDHLASMISSGTSISAALEVYVEDGKKGSQIIDGINKDIVRGKKLSEAMAEYPDTFSSLYIALISAGELTGNLDETLEYLANELRREHEFRERIKSAMFYPLLVLFVALVVVFLLVLVVIPRITLITKSFGGDLPAVTRIVSSISEFLTVYGPALIILVVIAIIAAAASLKNEKTAKALGPYLLKVPLVGSLLKKYILARFTRIVGSCIKYGISLITTLDLAGNVVGNIRYKLATERIQKKILKGVSLSEALSAESDEIFPNLIIRSVRGAEETGGVDKTLLQLSTSYEAQVDRDLKRVTDLIEPLLVVVLGVVVGAIAISVIAPIYQLTSRIR